MSALADFSVPVEVVEAWALDRDRIDRLTGGRTNLTLHAAVDGDDAGAGHGLVVQCLKSGSHDDLLGVMENLVRVTGHLEWKRGTGDRQSEPWFPTLRRTVAGKPYVMSESGDVWRAFAFRPGRIARGHQSTATMTSIAELYGQFSRQTADLGGPDLIETTSDFHDLSAVLADFEELVEATGGASDLSPERAEIERLTAVVEERSQADGLCEVAKRVVHNDTKLSNVLLAPEADRAIAVLDLDLAMMGPIWHDVGDLVRSACWHAGEGQRPVASAALFGEIITAFGRGAGQALDAGERATFAIAGPRISLELGVRYLTDHLRAEPRLRVDAPGRHLLRGKNNLKLAAEMIEAYDAFRSFADDPGASHTG